MSVFFDGVLFRLLVITFPCSLVCPASPSLSPSKQQTKTKEAAIAREATKTLTRQETWVYRHLFARSVCWAGWCSSR